ncbi:MAG: hypothetical protein GF331_15985 [Chitinivibrionales bacterium]|nr:hypothetical protein [Chitinivibrionales bacterium]
MPTRLGSALTTSTTSSICRQLKPISSASAAVVLGELDAAQHDLEQLRGLTRGSVSIAASDTVTRYLLTPVLARYLHEYPDIEITVANETSPEAVRMVQHMQADIGFVTMPLQAPRLTCRNVWSYREVAVCAPEHRLAHARNPVTMAELASSRLLLLERGTQSRALIEQMFGSAGLVVTAGMELASVEVQKDLAGLGLGVAIVPSYAVDAERERGRLTVVDLESSLAERTIGMIVRTETQLSPAVKAFCDRVR